MAQLIELPNGEWVDPETVARVIFPASRTVCVVTFGSGVLFLEFPDEAAARAWAADFGRRVNEGRAE